MDHEYKEYPGVTHGPIIDIDSAAVPSRKTHPSCQCFCGEPFSHAPLAAEHYSTLFCRAQRQFQKLNRNCPWKARPPVFVVEIPKSSSLMLSSGIAGVG